MVCRLQDLDGANVPHGLGVCWGILGFFHGKKMRLKKIALPKILGGNK
jgi:hypothetical protein